MSEITFIDGKRYRINGTVKTKLCNGIVVDDALEGSVRHCNARAMKGRDYCQYHGGKSLIGPAHPHFITGLASKNKKRFSSVGKQLLERIEELREDVDLFSLKDDAAFITAIMDKRAEAASEGVGIDQYKKVQAAYGLAHSKLGSPDFVDSFEQIGDVLTDTLSMYDASRDVIELIDKRVSIVEAEQRMMHAKAYTLEIDQAFSLVMQVLEIVRENVRSSEELIAIQAGFQKLLKVYQTPDDDVLDAEIVSES
jgi:hypothetical protein